MLWSQRLQGSGGLHAFIYYSFVCKGLFARLLETNPSCKSCPCLPLHLPPSPGHRFPGGQGETPAPPAAGPASRPLLCLLLLLHLPPSLLWTNTISHFGSQNGTGCFPSTAQTGCRAHHSIVKPQREAGQAATTRGAHSYLVCPPCVPLTSCLRVLSPVNSPQGERQACGSALGMAGKRLKAKR